MLALQLLDTWKTPHSLHRDIGFILLLFWTYFYVMIFVLHGFCRCLLGEILSICETPEWLYEIEVTTSAHLWATNVKVLHLNEKHMQLCNFWWADKNQYTGRKTNVIFFTNLLSNVHFQFIRGVIANNVVRTNKTYLWLLTEIIPSSLGKKKRKKATPLCSY